MTTFSAAIAASPKPLRVVVLPPSAFADTWDGKPSGEVAIGLRLLSQSDVDTGRREAEREATGFYAEMRGTPLPSDSESAVDIYNDALMMHACARAMTDPNDTRIQFFKAAEVTVRLALTPDGARRVYDEIVILHKGASPGRYAATDADVSDLAEVLASKGAALDDEARKLCGYLLEKLGGARRREPDGDDGEEGEVATYVARTA